MTELTSFTIAELRDGLRSRDFSAREIAEAYNAAVAAAKPLNGFVLVTGLGLLPGIPFFTAGYIVSEVVYRSMRGHSGHRAPPVQSAH